MKGLWNINFNDPRISVERTRISEIEIEAAKTEAGGFTRETLAKWGVPWPPMSGWRRAIEQYGIPLLQIDTSSKKAMKKSTKKAWELLAQIEEKPISQFPEKRRKALVPKEVRDEFTRSAEAGAFPGELQADVLVGEIHRRGHSQISVSDVG